MSYLDDSDSDIAIDIATDAMPSKFSLFIYGPDDKYKLEFATEAEYNELEIYKKEKYHPLESLQQIMNEKPIQHLTLSFSGRSNPAIIFIGTLLSPILPTLPLKSLRIIGCPLSASRSWIESPTVTTIEIYFVGGGVGMNVADMSSKFPKLRTLKLIPRYTYPLELSSIFIQHNKIRTLYIGKFILNRTSNNLQLTCPNLRTLTFDGICVLTTDVPRHSSGRVLIQRYLHRFFNGGLRSLHNLRSLFVTGRTVRASRRVVDVYNLQDLVKLKHSTHVRDTEQDTFMTISEMSNILQDCPKLVDFPWTCYTPTRPADMFPSGYTQFNHVWWKLLRRRGWGTTFSLNLFHDVGTQIDALSQWCRTIMSGHDIYSDTYEGNMSTARTVLQLYIEGMNRAGGIGSTSRDDFEHGAPQSQRRIAMSIFFPHPHIQDLHNQEFIDIMMQYVPTSADEPTQTAWGPLAAGVNQDCPISLENPIMTPCRSTGCEQGNHIFDMYAFYNALLNNTTCPLCRKPVSNVQVMSARDVREYHNARRTGIPRAEAKLRSAEAAVASAEAAVASTKEAIAETKRQYADTLQAAEEKQANAVAAARQTREMSEHDAEAVFNAEIEEIEQQRQRLLKQLEYATHAKEITEKQKEMLRHAVHKLRF